ncbi:unnamed protein product, partial [Chrysoparadoxa australica]
VLDVLAIKPALVPHYLRSLSRDLLEAKPSSRCLQAYSFVSQLLREAPAVAGDTASLRSLPPAALLALVIPSALCKKELSKGVLSPDAELKSATIAMIVAALERWGRLCALTRESSDGRTEGVAQKGVVGASHLLKSQLPDVQTLLSQRSKLEEAADQQSQVMYGQLLGLLECYQKYLPQAMEASRYDLLKLLPSNLAASPAAKQLPVLSLLHEAGKACGLRWLGSK